MSISQIEEQLHKENGSKSLESYRRRISPIGEYITQILPIFFLLVIALFREPVGVISTTDEYARVREAENQGF